ncbi:FecR family protein [Halobacteriovorax sp. GB3]|uniref:FecR family protein n=1 Tax=Halobacteriovorax sp. GB3 TaxID=2719615 RepID=UPI002360ABF2|nr:FecR family protein [Halobacteriovorax sp. GB3]MDD0852058.1 FecR family protein [Halobacteriovorax sp. GB3]
MKIILISFSLLFTQVTLATPVIGKATKVRGKVTLLNVGERDARVVKAGTPIRKDTSILTEKKSFVQITLFDKSKIILGPDSKMIIDKVPKQDTGIVNLMKGKVRSEVKKAATKNKDKLYIRTQTAAIGVRGTDFQTVYNPQNNITSLLTFEGEVAMAKTEKTKNLMDNEILKRELAKENVTKVKNGRYASVTKNLEKTTKPIKISPVQYTRLKLNKELLEDKKINEKVFEKELKKTVKEYAAISKEEKKENIVAKREYDVNNKSYRPTAGGVLDLETGLYIPPTIDDKKFNKELNIYELDTKKGSITSSGSYIPPKGIKLDAIKGFVGDGKKEEVSKLNREIQGQLVKPKKPTLDDLNSDGEDSYDKYFIIE